MLSTRAWIDPESRLPDPNSGGMFNAGVCWWHSRLQRRDGIGRFRWITGLRGRSRVPARTLEYIVERIHDMAARQGRIVYERLQIPGIASHALLVIGSRATERGPQPVPARELHALRTVPHV